MPRIYEPTTGPTENKVKKPVKETKTTHPKDPEKKTESSGK